MYIKKCNICRVHLPQEAASLVDRAASLVDRYEFLSTQSSAGLVSGTQIYFPYLSFTRTVFLQHSPFCPKASAEYCFLLPGHLDIQQARVAEQISCILKVESETLNGELLGTSQLFY